MIQGRENTQMNIEEEIDLGRLFLYLKKKLPLIIIAFFIGLTGAGVFTHFCIAPKYTATSKLYVVSASGKSVVNLDDLRLGTSLSADYKELLLTRPICMEVISDLKLDCTYGALRDMITVDSIEDTRVLVIRAVSTNPKEAKDIANSLADKAVTYLPKLMDITPPNIAEEAIEPTGKSSPSLTRHAMMGGILALVAAVGILTVLFLMDDTVKTAEDVEKLIGAMPLTSIPESRDASKDRQRKRRKG